MPEKKNRRYYKILKIISEFPRLKAPINYHPSECVNSNIHPQSDSTKLTKTDVKIFDVINDYHTYCNVCQQHFYTTSKLNDINSFFQTHLNSINHLWKRRIYKWPATKPIFEWEKWLCTGYCAICKKSGIKAFIIDTQIDASHILQTHLKGKLHRDKHDFILNNPFNRFIAKYNMFTKIYIDKISKSVYLCRICCLRIDQESLLEYHLNSKEHENNFHSFMKKYLNIYINISFKNKLKQLAKRLKKLDVMQEYAPPIHKNIHPYQNSENAFCIETELKFFTGPDYGFSPSALEKMHSLLDKDLLQGTYCALCQEHTQNMSHHLSSGTHQLRIWLFNRCNAIRPVSLIDYLYNMSSPPHKLTAEVETYKKFKLSLRKINLDFGITFKPEYFHVALEWEQPNVRFILEEVNKIVEEYSRNRNNDHSHEISQLAPTKRTVENMCPPVEVDSKASKMKESHLKVTTKGINEKEILYNKSTNENIVGTEAEEFKIKFSSDEESSEYEESSEDVISLCETVTDAEMDTSEISTNAGNEEKTQSENNILEKVTLQRPEMVNTGKIEEKKSVTPIRNNNSPKKLQIEEKDNTKKVQMQNNAGQSVTRKKNNQSGTDFKKCVETLLSKCEDIVSEYLCAICLVNESLTLLRDHLYSRNHTLNENFIKSKWTPNVTICKFCNLLILGTSDMFRQHYTSSYHIERESKKTGREIVPQELVAKPKKILIITGVPDVERKDKDEFLRILLEPFGKINILRVKRSYCEVHFAEQDIVPFIVARKKIWLSPHTCLKFSMKTVKYDLEIGMKSNLIGLLSHSSGFEKFISHLVLRATRMLRSTEERRKEDLLCTSLEKVLKNNFPNCACHKFGSRVTGLTIGDCDLDVFFDYDNVYYTENNEQKVQGKIVEKVAAALRSSNHFTQIIGIQKCRVPIVTCLHRETGIHCDISFRNGLSCENTNLIKFLISLDDRVKGVILFLKYWVKMNELHGRPLFSSYALTMFVVFYLQQKPNPILPTVEYLQYCHDFYENQKKVIGDWDCGYSENPDFIPKTTNTDTTVELIHGFFQFCDNFDFSKNIISPLTGKPLPRDALCNTGKYNLPSPYNKYQSKINPSHYTNAEPICIMDPFDLSHNLTKSFPNFSFQKFRYQCRLSSTLISSFLQSKNCVHLSRNPPEEFDSFLTNLINSL